MSKELAVNTILRAFIRLSRYGWGQQGLENYSELCNYVVADTDRGSRFRSQTIFLIVTTSYESLFPHQPQVSLSREPLNELISLCCLAGVAL